MPDVLPISDGKKIWNLVEIDTLNTAPAASINYYKNQWIKSEFPPYRITQFLGSDKNSLDVAFSHGYSITTGDSRPEIRRTKVDSAWQLAYTKKSYPYSITNRSYENQGFSQSISAFRCYSKPGSYSKNATNVFWHEENKDIILICDYHKIALNDTISLPLEFNNRVVEVITKSDSLDIVTNFIIDNKIVVSSSSNYSYAHLRLLEFNPPINVNIIYESSEVNLTWSNAIGATSYRIFRSADPYSGFVEIGTSTVPSYTDTDVTGSTKYFYKVTAVN